MMKANRQQPVDAIVIGAGPVGSYVALQLAKLGVNVLVFEEHPTVGVPSHCAGHISIRSLKNMGLYPLPEGMVENTFSVANFYSPAGTKFSLHLSRPVTAAVNRAMFDQYLAKQAEAAGASLSLNSRVQSLVIENGFVRGVDVNLGGTKERITSKIVLDAEGISSRLLRQTGLTALKANGLLYAVEADAENVQDFEQDAVSVFFGKSYAPGFYGWLIPRRDGTAKVGLATNNGNPQEFLNRLMFKHPIASKMLSKSKITKINYHAISLGGPIERIYANGFLAVGDCASQVKPTTGGGVIFGLTCAKLAAEVASQALKQGDVSADFLRVYQQRCDELYRFDFRVMLRLRRFLNSLSDDKLDEMLRYCGKLGVDRALSNADEIDFQGRLLLEVLWKPSVLATLMYFGFAYLFASS
ncbi:MAG: NAD(P)/FAD-dependent oxidoreductase [Candidatus Bathyarchaeota archaeon]|nr:NAD(P)/FAD-dependent oxidoreductase [Candidatus Bathyarchaeota archaeon]